MERLAHLGPGARAAAQRRQATLRLEERRRRDRQAFQLVHQRRQRVGRAFIEWFLVCFCKDYVLFPLYQTWFKRINGNPAYFTDIWFKKGVACTHKRREQARSHWLDIQSHVPKFVLWDFLFHYKGYLVTPVSEKSRNTSFMAKATNCGLADSWSSRHCLPGWPVYNLTCLSNQF